MIVYTILTMLGVTSFVLGIPEAAATLLLIISVKELLAQPRTPE
ncbi:MAG TPA: hypothetical protein VKX28_26380 [Xanthobacteraceae bacterium]|nr:hypothetical protein [Xanthobacteraceae bacterium]